MIFKDSHTFIIVTILTVNVRFDRDNIVNRVKLHCTNSQGRRRPEGRIRTPRGAQIKIKET